MVCALKTMWWSISILLVSLIVLWSRSYDSLVYLFTVCFVANIRWSRFSIAKKCLCWSSLFEGDFYTLSDNEIVAKLKSEDSRCSDSSLKFLRSREQSTTPKRNVLFIVPQIASLIIVLSSLSFQVSDLTIPPRFTHNQSSNYHHITLSDWQVSFRVFVFTSPTQPCHILLIQNLWICLQLNSD